MAYLQTKVITKNHNVSANDEAILVLTQENKITISLPPTSGQPEGRELFFKDIGNSAATNNIIIYAPDGSLFDGVSKFAIINVNGGSIGIIKSGNGWNQLILQAGSAVPPDGSITAAKLAAASVILNSSTVTNTLPIGNGGTGNTSGLALPYYGTPVIIAGTPGASSSGAAAIVAPYTVITGTSGNVSAILPANPILGQEYLIEISGSEVQLVLFPPIGGQIDENGVNTFILVNNISLNQISRTRVKMVAYSTSQWYYLGQSSDYASSVDNNTTNVRHYGFNDFHGTTSQIGNNLIIQSATLDFRTAGTNFMTFRQAASGLFSVDGGESPATIFQFSTFSNTNGVILPANTSFPSAVTLTPAATATTCDFTTGSTQTVSLATATGSVAVSLTNGMAGGRYKIIISQGSTPRAVTWTGVRWPNGTPPTITSIANAIDIIDLYFDGTSYYGTFAQKFS